MRLSAGSLRHRVMVEERSATPKYDGAGQPVENWEPVASAWARVEPLRGRELFRAREAGHEATHRVRMRWQGSFRDGDCKWRIGRIIHDGRTLYPEGPPMDLMEHGRAVEILATERTDG